MFNFTDAQNEAKDKATKYLDNFNPDENPFPFRISGFAGTGKTTLVKYLLAENKLRAQFAAYTGKAALVMRRYNGVQARTIHSLIYKYIPVDKELCERIHSDLQSETDPKERKRLMKELEKAQEPRFDLNDESDLHEADVLVLDECSMVNDEILNDLRAFRKPIIALGDPGQLPPIDGPGALFKTPPEVLLTDIHRQALDNPIIEASMLARRGIPLKYMDPDDPDALLRVVMPGDPRKDDWFVNFDQVLTGKNDTRRKLNTHIRNLRGLGGMDPYPVEGDRIICLKNNNELGLFNGMMAEVTRRGEVLDHSIQLMIKPETNPENEMQVEVARAHFDEYIEPGTVKMAKFWELQAEHFDFGYAITVHKSQGSQWPSVVLFDDGFLNWGPKHAKERSQWVYTAVTRAAERLVVMRNTKSSYRR